MEGERGALRGRTLFILSIAVLAVILAIVGMYGLTSYNTEVRAKDFGIRIALGASPPKLVQALLGELWLVALMSVGIAWAASGRLTVFLDDMLRNPMMEHPLIVFRVVPAIAAAAGLCVVMLLGTAVPLRRVLRMDVMRAMQSGSTA